MRKLILVAALAALPSLVSAQSLKAGTLQLSGASGLQFGSNKLEQDGFADFDTTVRQLGGDALYYVTPIIGVGVTVSYVYQKLDDGVDTQESTDTAFGPIVGLNLPIGEKVALSAFGGFGRQSTEFDNGFVTTEGDGWGIFLGGGLKVFPVQSVSLDLGLQLSRFGLDFDGQDVTSTNVALRAGISVYLGGR
jgi:hypothetical protein